MKWFGFLFTVLFLTANAFGSFFIPDGAITKPKLNASIVETNLQGNYSLSSSVAANALTIVLKDAVGNNLSATNYATFSFRNVTATTGQTSTATATGNKTIVVPASATLGQISGINQYVWVYVLNDAGTVDICVSGVDPFFDGTVYASTQITSGATSGSVLYCTNSHSGSKATHLVGRLLVNEATAGTWASNATEVSIGVQPIFNTNQGTYVPTITATAVNPTKGTVAYDLASWQRFGKYIYIIYEFSNTSGGSGGTGTYLWSLPSVTADASYFTLDTINSAPIVGSGNFGTTSPAGMAYGNSSLYDSTHIIMNANAQQVSSGFAPLGAAVRYGFSVQFAVSGWSAYGP